MTGRLTLGDLSPEAHASGAAARAVTGVALDSRRVAPGDVFFALPGTRADGMAFVAQALAAGAAAVVGEGDRPDALGRDVAYVRVSDVRRALALAAARVHPRQPETIVAVTGTSGKTSVADFARQIFAALGARSASVGTLGIITSEGAAYGSLTTPDPLTLHATLDRLAGEGVTHLAMEASSHGLDQRRLDGVRLVAGAFTNLGRDHLDYHADEEEYLAAKARLFEALLPDGAPAVVNLDGDRAHDIQRVALARGLRVLAVGEVGEAIRLAKLSPDGFGQVLDLVAEGRAMQVRLPLVGRFQVENALVAAALVAATGAPVTEAIAAIAGLKGVPGRLEAVGEARGALAIVDYAHKPEALAAVLDTLRPYASGRLVLVMGCGGDRDRGKRAIMGRIAATRADLVHVTDDNPRTEDPAAIRAEILAAAPGAIEIGDRREAIRAAVRELRTGDVLVVAGKGHETGQIVGDTTLPFSDHDEIRAAFREFAA